MGGRVSIITPCYNSENYFGNYSQNILSQTYREVEVIFVNDGSTDAIGLLIQGLRPKVEAKGYTFMYIEQANKGISGAINAGLKVMTGDYLMLLDMDDTLYPDAIKAKADFLNERKNYDAVINNGCYTFSTNKGRCWKFNKKKYLEKGDLFEKLLLSQRYNWPGSYMIRVRTLLGYYPDRHIYESRFGQNLQLILPVAKFGRVGYIHKCLMNYYIHNDSMSHSGCPLKMLESVNGYERNKIAIIKELDLNKEERKKYIDMVKIKYMKDRMRFHIRYRNGKMAKEEYAMLKEIGAVSFWEKVLMYMNKCPYFSLVYRACTKVLVIIKRDVL